MAKVVKVSDGNYRIAVAEDHRITLDVGPGGRGDGEGTVSITGDLMVEGVTTSIETVNTVIEDNIITLNKNDGTSGVIGDNGTSGLEIDRGSKVNAYWLFTESVTWYVPSGVTLQGTFRASDQDGRILGLQTPNITTDGSDLNLLGPYSTSGGIQANPGLIRVAGEDGSPYLAKINATKDPGDPLSEADGNIIPNVSYVNEYVTTFFNNTVPNRIQAGIVPDDLTIVRTFDNSQDGGTSNITLTVDGNIVQQNFADYVEMYGLIIEDTDLGTEIKTSSTSSQDLILGAMGTGSVVVEDNLRISRIGHEGDDRLEPSAPVGDEGTVIYSDHSGAGATGLYFVNTKIVTNAGDEQRDELISRNRALVYSMLF